MMNCKGNILINFNCKNTNQRFILTILLKENDISNKYIFSLSLYILKKN